MKNRKRNKNCSALTVAAYLVMTTTLLNMAHASVYDDCVVWWHFDYDANSDGRANLDEIRDQRDWGTTAVKGSTGKHATQTLGLSGGPSWTNRAVICPAGGQNYGNMSMSFNPAITPVTANCYPDTFNANIGVGGSATIVTRFYWEGFATDLSESRSSWLFNNALEWNAYRGWLFGINYKDFPCLTLYTQAEPFYMSSALTSNVWYDVAMVITDGGTNTSVDTIEFYLWKEDSALIYQKNNTTKPNAITNSIGTGGTIIGCQNAVAKYDSNVNSRKAFKGSVNHLAVWDRALSFNEVNEAFGYPQPLFQIGLKNNSNSDLRMESETDAEYWRGDPWHTMRRGLNINHTNLTIKLELDILQSALDYAFHLRTASTEGSQTAALELIVNNTNCGLKSTGLQQDYLWHIPQSLLITGTNTFMLRYAGGPATYVSFDWMELGGAWQVGYDDLSPAEFIIESSAPDDFYVTNPNWKHLARAVKMSNPKINIHFTLSPEMIAKYTYTYTTRVVNQGPEPQRPFTVGFNDTVVQSYPEGGLPSNTLVSIPIPPELLLPGDNAINLIYCGTNSYTQFDFHRLQLKPLPSGAIIFVR